MAASAVRRVEDPPLLRGEGRYVADLDLDGAAVVAYATSPVAHGRIRSLEVSAARALPGVLEVATAADLDLGPVPALSRNLPETMARPLLAAETVRYAGEPVVAVVAETLAAAEDALEAVVLEVDPLPAVVDLEQADRGEVLVFPEAGTNVAAEASGGSEDADPDGCEVVVAATLRNQRLAPCPLEGRAAAAAFGPDGRLVYYSSCQGAHPVRALLCQVYGLEPERVRVVVPEVGGSFGSKARPSPEELLLPWLARRVGRPVRFVPPRTADMVGLGHSRSQLQRVRIGGRRDGTIEVLAAEILADCGAYPVSGPFLPRNTGALLSGAYKVASVRWSMRALVTTTTPIVAYRGAGRPEAAALVERAVDLFAAEIGMDPAEVRRRNLVPASAFPYRTPTGVTHDSGDYHRVLEAALAAAGYEALRAEQRRRREAGEPHELGIGLATFVDRTAGIPGTEYAAVELRPDGSLRVLSGSTPYGQGHRTAWAALVAERTGVPIARIEVVCGDTDLVPRGAITGGSRSAQRAGAAVAVAADELVRRAREAAAALLEAAPEDVVLELASGGRFHVAGTPARAVDWEALARSGLGQDGPGLRCEVDVGGEATVPFGAYVAVVDVDTETGAVRLERLVTVDDAGRILNPTLALGQVHGGVAQGAAQALFEEFVYDADGNPRTASFADYLVPSAAELPSFESALVETPSPNNPLGAKGIAESGAIGAPPAVQNAVLDALSPYGVRHLDMPLTPERVWRAIHGR